MIMKWLREMEYEQSSYQSGKKFGIRGQKFCVSNITLCVIYKSYACIYCG